jgi:enoyl-CoA hydratase
MSNDAAGYERFKGLRIDRPAEGVLRVTIDNPVQRNALHRDLLESVHHVWDAIDADPETRVTIITGAGKAFCAGGAFDAMPTGSGEKNAEFVNGFYEARALVARIINSHKPIVSAINGPAVGAGLAIALLADIPIAARDAKLFDGHLRIGVAPGDHALIIWPLLCGLAKSKYHLMTNAPLTGEEAERANLVALAVDADELQAKAIDVAVGLAATAPTALRMTKYLLNAYLRRNQDIFDLSAAFEMINFGSAENKEAVRAFKAGEAPTFGQPKADFR